MSRLLIGAFWTLRKSPNRPRTDLSRPIRRQPRIQKANLLGGRKRPGHQKRIVYDEPIRVLDLVLSKSLSYEEKKEKIWGFWGLFIGNFWNQKNYGIFFLKYSLFLLDNQTFAITTWFVTVCNEFLVYTINSILNLSLIGQRKRIQPSY